jgi:hypothetical protein
MRRLQLFEILDQAGCPRALRDGATDCLEAIISATDIYRPVRLEVLEAIHRCGANRIVDLCSGGGGPWLSAQWASAVKERRLRVFLTDKFPSEALETRLGDSAQFVAIARPIDATNVPPELLSHERGSVASRGFRTVFSSLHHFPDAMALSILSDAVRSREGFASAEVTSRSWRAVLAMLLTPLLAWRITLRIRPFRWSRLFLTYVVPAIPIVLMWDGVISCLRTRTPEELLALTKPFSDYVWKTGFARGRGTSLPPVYLIGWPRELADQPG